MKVHPELFFITLYKRLGNSGDIAVPVKKLSADPCH